MDSGYSLGYKHLLLDVYVSKLSCKFVCIVFVYSNRKCMGKTSIFILYLRIKGLYQSLKHVVKACSLLQFFFAIHEYLSKKIINGLFELIDII